MSTIARSPTAARLHAKINQSRSNFRASTGPGDVLDEVITLKTFDILPILSREPLAAVLLEKSQEQCLAVAAVTVKEQNLIPWRIV